MYLWVLRRRNSENILLPLDARHWVSICEQLEDCRFGRKPPIFGFVPEPKEPAIRALGAGVTFLVGWLGAAFVALILYWGLEANDHARLLQLAKVHEGPGAKFEMAAALVSKTVLVLLPALVFSALAFLRGAAGQGAAWGRGALLFFGIFYLLADRSLFLSVGRHLSDLWAFRNVPHGHQAAGDFSLWIGSSLWAAFLSGMVAVAGTWGWTWSERKLLPRLSRVTGAVRITVGVLAGCLCAAVSALTLLPHGPSLSLSSGMRERLYEALPFDPRWTENASPSRASSAPLVALQREMESSYREHFGALKNQRALLPPQFEAKQRPPIVYVVVESLRRDALGPETMPRLSLWAQEQATVFLDHEAGTYSSEAGLFSLLYGRSNVVFHETLDAQVAPLTFQWLRSLGYETAYFTGHPVKWLRREEFLSKGTVDRFFHDDRGTWPEWDRRALDSMVKYVGGSQRPTFSLVFLMATHFEYQYPPEYEKNLPVAKSKFRLTEVTALGERDRIPHLNRYKNSLAFIDDVVTDALQKLPEDALIVFTGDHGESFYEGKLYGHGYAFTDAVLEVPLFVRFPKGTATAKPAEVKSLTLHRDIVGWLARYLHGSPLFLDGFHGRQTWDEAPDGVLSAYASPSKNRVYAMLRVAQGGQGDLRLRLTLSSLEPRVSLLGFEDRYGQAIATPELSRAQRDALLNTFHSELARLVK